MFSVKVWGVGTYFRLVRSAHFFLQFIRWIRVAPLKRFANLDPRSGLLIDSQGTRDAKWYGQYRSDRSVSDAPCKQSDSDINKDTVTSGETLLSRMLSARGGWETVCVIYSRWNVCINFPPLGFAGRVHYNCTHRLISALHKRL